MLGNRRGAPGAVDTHQRRVVRRRGHDDGPLEPLPAEDLLDELTHLATTLTDQGHDDDIRRRVLGHHPQQRTLADTAAGEQAEALPLAHREQGIDRAHTDVQGLANRPAQQRIDRRTAQGALMRADRRSAAVEKPAGPVQHPAEELLVDGHRRAVTHRPHPRTELQAGDVALGHQHQAPIGEADDLRLDTGARTDNATAAAHGTLAALGLELHADHAHETALAHQCGLDNMRRRSGAALTQALPLCAVQGAGVSHRPPRHPRRAPLPAPAPTAHP
jgi:hypothetical protein